MSLDQPFPSTYRRELFPPIEPYAEGWLPVGDGHTLYWYECGNPMGRPAVFLHGGPGAGCISAYRRFFDPTQPTPPHLPEFGFVAIQAAVLALLALLWSIEFMWSAARRRAR